MGFQLTYFSTGEFAGLSGAHQQYVQKTQARLELEKVVHLGTGNASFETAMVGVP